MKYVDGGTAVVIGASITGTLVAAVLRSHFSRVILIDRDSISAQVTTRSKVPQEHHVHLLLQRGRENIELLYPNFLAELESDGAEIIDLSHGVKWHLAGRWKNRWPTGITAHYCSRTLVEHHLRRRALSLDGVELLQNCTVQKPIWDDKRQRITGVKIKVVGGSESEIKADFVLDASGRWSKAPAWLEESGFDIPQSEQVTSNLGYASRIYRRDTAYAGKWNVLLVTPRLPKQRRMGVISPIEGDRWMVTLGGWLGEFPKPSEESFLTFMRSLPVSDIHDVISAAEPLSEVRRFSLSGGLRHRYDKLKSFPEGFFVLGDAICSLNPIYSQGMSVSSMQVMAFADGIDAFLKGGINAPDLFRKTIAATESSWKQAQSSDELFAEVRGENTRRNYWRDAYFDELVQASAVDRDVTVALLKANNLVEDAPSLMGPNILYRVFKNTVGRYTGSSII